MTQTTGMVSITDLLAVRHQSVAEFGMDTVARVLQADIDAHNVITGEMIADLAEPTADRQRISGASGDGEMNETDEFGNAPTQKTGNSATVAFPLRGYQFNLGWTRKFLENATPADLAQMVLNAEKADLRGIQKGIKQAVYLSANYNFVDRLVDRVTLAVKRLANADGDPIPDGPNGETFDGATHTHYLANAGWDAAKLLDTINTVVEHGHGGQVRVAIARADEASVKALAGFEKYEDPRVIFRVSDTPGQTLDITRLDNRAIGIFGAAEVWVKPWAISKYAFAWDKGGTMKPLVYRQRTAKALRGLRIAAELAEYPLFARIMENEYGFGVWNRTNGAVLFADGAAYTDPTI